MPDIKSFAITRSGNSNLNVPTWSIAGQLINTKTGAVIQDFTGANAISFPQVLGNLTVAQQDELVSFLVLLLLQRRFPAAF